MVERQGKRDSRCIKGGIHRLKKKGTRRRVKKEPGMAHGRDTAEKRHLKAEKVSGEATDHQAMGRRNLCFPKKNYACFR